MICSVVPFCAPLLDRAAVRTVLHQFEKVAHFCPEQRFTRQTTFWLDRVDSPHLCCDQSAKGKTFSQMSLADAVIAQTTIIREETRLPFHLALLS